MLILRAFLAWLILLVSAVANGAVRAALLKPRMTELHAHQVSSLAGSGLILVVTCLLSRWLNARGTTAALGVGALWVVWTVAFELVFGRLVAGASLDRLLGDYDLRAGRLWPLVLTTIFLAPLLAATITQVRFSTQR